MYAYRARDSAGRLREGNFDAPDEVAVVRHLRSQGLTTTHVAAAIAPAEKNVLTQPITLPGFFKRPVKLKHLSIAARQLATMIGAGLSILMSLRILADQSGDKRLREILLGVADGLESGKSLSDSFEAYVPDIPQLMISMLQAGEVGGVLEEVFSRLAEQFEKEHNLSEKVKSALVYPKIVMVGALGMVIFLVVSILPSFTILFSQFDADLPMVTRVVMGGGNWAQAHLTLLLAAGFVVYVGFRVILHSKTGQELADRVSLRIPVLGELLLKRSMARFTRTLSTLLSSGVPILIALQVAQRTMDNSQLERTVAAARANIQAGRNLSGPLREQKLFPRMLVEMAAVGEETGALDTMLDKAADFYEQETATTVDRLTAMLEPAIMIVMALVVGTIISAVFLPLYQILGSLE